MCTMQKHCGVSTTYTARRSAASPTVFFSFFLFKQSRSNCINKIKLQTTGPAIFSPFLSHPLPPSGAHILSAQFLQQFLFNFILNFFRCSPLRATIRSLAACYFIFACLCFPPYFLLCPFSQSNNYLYVLQCT